MTERYWISGVQLGMIKVLSRDRDVLKLVDEIEDKQFVGHVRERETK